MVNYSADGFFHPPIPLYFRRENEMVKKINPGVYPTMITPYTKDNKVDFDAVLGILDFYKTHGVDGVFAICQSSEIFFLSFEERLELLKFVMKNAPAGMSIVASGHTADDLDRQIYEANAFINEGIDAYVFIANRFAAEDEDDSVFLKRYETMVKGIPEVALGIYECPYPYKRVMTPETLRACTDISPLRFIKDTCCSVPMMEKKMKAVEGTGLGLFNANGATLLETLKLGAAGYSGVMGNFHPEIYSWLCKNWQAEPEKAQKVQDFLGFASTIECQAYPVNAKYHMNLCGVPMEIICRSADASKFGESRRMEIDQMFRVEQEFKKLNNIG